MRFGSKVISHSIANELERTAYHEAGHTVAIRLYDSKAIISQATIISRGNSAGLVAREFQEIRYETDKETFQQQIRIALAGRIVESIKYGEDKIGVGAYSDITAATQLAYEAIAKFGMDNSLMNCNAQKLMELTSIRNGQHGISNVPYLSEKIAKLVEEWITQATEDVRKLLDTHWDKVEQIAQELLKQETLNHMEIVKIL
jgi:ATP-dependent Zn protease